MDDPSHKPGLLDRLSALLLREPEDREQLIELLHSAYERHLIDSDALSIIEGALAMSEIAVRDIMVPRAQMDMIDIEDPPESFIPFVLETAHSRFPVFEGERDKVLGILLAKDVLRFYAEASFDVREMLRPAVFVPESKRLNMVLRDFRANRNHMAIVVDEYGGVAGLVTIEDVLEQIVGDIDDEYDYDEDEDNIVEEQPGRYRCKAQTEIADFNEMLLADLRQIPAIGPLLLPLHGVWSLLFWLLGVAVLRELLPGDEAGNQESTARWPWIVLLVVPTLFQELVLIKNDLFVAVPAVAVLAWIITRARTARPRDLALVLSLAGFVVAVKLTMMPLLLVAGGAILLQRRTDGPAIGAAALGTLAGMIVGGLAFTLIANLQFYGQLMPAGDQGNLTVGVAGVLTSLGRFAISLVDLGLLTRIWWPGRGGWGSTFGLPFIWACAVLVWASLRLPTTSATLTRMTLLCTAVYFLAFAAVFPDADLAHRLALAPALLVIAVAVRTVEHGDRARAWRLALVPVTLLSGAQIVRSASLYFVR